MPEEISGKRIARLFTQSLQEVSKNVSYSVLKNKRIETNKVNSTGLLEICINTTLNHLFENIGNELHKNVLKDNRLKENWITTAKDLIKVATPDSWTKWNSPMKLADRLRLIIGSEKGFLVVQYLSDLVYYALILYGNEQIESCKPMVDMHIRLDVPITIDQVEYWTNSVGVKESAIILRDQEMTGNYLLNNLSQAYVESCAIKGGPSSIISALASSQIEVISGKTTARSFIQNYWQGLSKVASIYNSVFKNWATMAKDLRETPGLWIKWNVTTKPVEPRLKIIFEKGFLIVQGLRDLVCYVVDLSEVPKCGSFNPYGNEQMAEDFALTGDDQADLYGLVIDEGEYFNTGDKPISSLGLPSNYSFFRNGRPFGTLDLNLKKAVEVGVCVRRCDDIEVDKQAEETKLIQTS